MPKNDIFNIFTKSNPCTPKNTSVHFSYHSQSTCGLTAAQSITVEYQNVIQNCTNGKTAGNPQKSGKYTIYPIILVLAPRLKAVKEHRFTPNHTKVGTPTPQPDTMSAPRPPEYSRTGTERIEAPKSKISKKLRISMGFQREFAELGHWPSRLWPCSGNLGAACLPTPPPHTH